jgi:hypothetical protein
MRREHIKDGWWEMPGEPVPALVWPGTKNAAPHRVWLSAPVQALMAEFAGEAAGFVFAGQRQSPITGLDGAMRAACGKLGVERATPHDLRRTFSTTVTGLGFGRDALNRHQSPGGRHRQCLRPTWLCRREQASDGSNRCEDHGAGRGVLGRQCCPHPLNPLVPHPVLAL